MAMSGTSSMPTSSLGRATQRGRSRLDAPRPGDGAEGLTGAMSRMGMRGGAGDRKRRSDYFVDLHTKPAHMSSTCGEACAGAQRRTSRPLVSCSELSSRTPL